MLIFQGWLLHRSKKSNPFVPQSKTVVPGGTPGAAYYEPQPHALPRMASAAPNETNHTFSQLKPIAQSNYHHNKNGHVYRYTQVYQIAAEIVEIDVTLTDITLTLFPFAHCSSSFQGENCVVPSSNLDNKSEAQAIKQATELYCAMAITSNQALGITNRSRVRAYRRY